MKLWENITPMLLSEVKKPFDDKNYIFEVKFDGVRALIYINDSKVIIKSRRNIDLTYLYPELQSIKELVKSETILDGEIICTKNGLPSFENLQMRNHLKDKNKIIDQSKSNPVTFMCFDIIYSSKSLIKKTLLERKKELQKIEDNEEFIKVSYVEKEGIKFFKKIKQFGLEGIVAKEKTSIYENNKRSKHWIKIKNWKSDNFCIGGYYEEKSKYVFSVCLGELVDNKFYHVGNVSLSKKNKLYNELKSIKKLENSPFINYENKKVSYVRYKNKVNVEFMERTKNNTLRQPIFVRVIR